MVIFNSYFDITRGYIHVISSLRSAIASSATSSKSLMVVSKSTKAPGVPVKISATWPKNRWVMKVCGPQQAKHILNKDWMIQLRAVCRSFWWSYSASKTLSLRRRKAATRNAAPSLWWLASGFYRHSGAGVWFFLVDEWWKYPSINSHFLVTSPFTLSNYICI